jgi:Ca2+-binding EF-hand superfamily protein
MRKTITGMALLLLSTPALAQMGGGGMGGGGMGGGPGGGMGGDEGGGMGRHHGGMGGGEMGGGPGGGRPHAPEMKPIKREKLDKPVKSMFDAADSNHDGMVTLDELEAVLVARRDAIIRARFDRIDTNHDKLISPQEFIAWQTSLGSVASSDEEVIGDHGGPVAESIAPVVENTMEGRMLKRLIEPLSATVFTNANTNYDRGITLDELLTYERKRFDDADTNKDGELSAEELRALMPKGRGGMRGGPGGMEGGPPPGPRPGE